MRALRAGWGAALWGLLATGCLGGSGVRLSELPAAPIALLYRTPDEAHDRAQRLRAARAGRTAPRGIARLSEIERLLGRGGGPGRGGEGRVALLAPRDGETKPIPGLPHGAMPLSWSPDRERLLLTALVRGRRQLVELDLRTRELNPRTHGPTRHPMGCYLPGGRLAVVEASGRGRKLQLRIGVTSPGGGAVRLLTEGPLDLFPACSPDGRFVSFTQRLRGGTDRIALIRLHDGSVRSLAAGRHPVFVPEGDWIVYSAQTSHGQRLWRVRPDGSGKAPLGTRWGSNGEEGMPAVSPDGRFVAYVLRENDRDRLRLRRIDGQGDRPLLGYGDGTLPVW